MLFSLSSEVSWSIFFFQSPWRLFPHRQYSHCSMSVYFFQINPCPCFHQKSMFPSNEKVNVPSLFFDRNVLLIFPLAVRDGCHFATSSPTVTPPPLTPTRLLHIFGTQPVILAKKMINPWSPLLDLFHVLQELWENSNHNFMEFPLSQERVGTC